ncbi:hypothetical protein ACFQV2_20035 [Actinokineospora soli]|uniref:Uncharacterized protein n=1 Tax=Actinokineospora soli TaxID=1048753 RepID=A0ABW2TR09_9PSEU
MSRNRLSGAMPSAAVSTRLGMAVPPNATSGSAAVPPTSPVCRTDLSHSAAFSPSPGSGNWWSSRHSSTGSGPVPRHTSVVTEARRLVDQKVGECLPGHVAAAHLLLHGTSGQLSGFASTHSPPGTHRFWEANTTRADGVVTPSRRPYSARARTPPRM